jgi:Ca2+/Na+ antiporter
MTKSRRMRTDEFVDGSGYIRRDSYKRNSSIGGVLILIILVIIIYAILTYWKIILTACLAIAVLIVIGVVIYKAYKNRHSVILKLNGGS